jgi:hypothetical protein
VSAIYLTETYSSIWLVTHQLWLNQRNPLHFAINGRCICTWCWSLPGEAGSPSEAASWSSPVHAAFQGECSRAARGPAVRIYRRMGQDSLQTWFWGFPGNCRRSGFRARRSCGRYVYEEFFVVCSHHLQAWSRDVAASVPGLVTSKSRISGARW